MSSLILHHRNNIHVYLRVFFMNFHLCLFLLCAARVYILFCHALTKHFSSHHAKHAYLDQPSFALCVYRPPTTDNRSDHFTTSVDYYLAIKRVSSVF